MPSAAFGRGQDRGFHASQEITAFVSAWRVGAISRETMLERLKRGEVLPDGRSVAQERALIHGKARADRVVNAPQQRPRAADAVCKHDGIAGSAAYGG